MVELFSALKASYKPVDRLGKKGRYIKDKELSNDNQQVYYNQKKKKLLYTVAGTHNLSDVGTDAYLAIGHLKDTNRYKEADETLKKAKAKYNPVKTIGAGHSLGGSIISYLPVDKATTLDKGATIFSTTRSKENAYRTSGDMVSLLNSNSTRMKTLSNPTKRSGIFALDALNAHNVSNIKNSNLFI